ncbi:S8 family serine peptidase [Haloarchaeobius sp. TZWWS8]|uniref:S8 family serine peptidase n=1 Tax=Haloarchaeobius sp. TZWWS8 TaxID=3446121 RepID=UPI003EB7CA02
MTGNRMVGGDHRKGLLAITLATLALLGAVTPALAAGSTAVTTAGTDSPARTAVSPGGQQGPPVASVGTVPAPQQPQNRTVAGDVETTNVTLITGQTVTVVESGGETTYRIDASEPMRRIDTADGTYIFPQSVDFSTFDHDLFNVDLLVSQNVTDDETGEIPLIVQHGNGGTGDGADVQALGSSLKHTAGVQTTRTLRSVDGVAATVEKATVRDSFARLATNPRVRRVSLDQRVRVQLDEANTIVNATSARQNYGVNGTNVTVAVLDTGVDNDHPMLAGAVTHEYDVVENDNVSQDGYGHGTHVAGIVAGRPNGSAYSGIAPNASIMDIRVLDSGGYGYRSDIIAGMEYAVDNDADVISMSLGGPTSSDDPYIDAVQNATDAGVPVVVSAGNSGPSPETIGSPGVAPAAITVGATTKSDTVTGFSSRGPTPVRQYVKPDIVAPGDDIMSAEAGTDGYVAFSGTSMAAPMVSGAAALVMAEHPDWNVSQVRSALVTTTDRIGDYHVYESGSGRLNVSTALGNDLMVAPSTVQFGLVEGEQTANVTLHNGGNDTMNLSLDATVTNVGNGSAGAVRLDRTSLSLAPNETQNVSLLVDGSEAVGVVSGRLFVNDSDAPAGDQSWRRASFGFVSEASLTVQANGLNGSNVSGDDVYITQTDGPVYDIATLDENGTYQTVLEPGNYTVVVFGRDETADNRSVFSIASLDFDGDTTLVLNESDTVRYTVNPSNLSATNESVTAISRSLVTEASGVPLWFDDATFPRNQTFRISAGPTVNVSTRTLAAPSSAYPNGTFHYDTPVLYDVVNVTFGVSGPVTHRPTSADLTARTVTYHRTDPTAALDVGRSWQIPAAPEHRWYGEATRGSLRNRTSQTVYQSATAAGEAVAYRISATGPGWMAGFDDSYTRTPSDPSSTSVNEFPLLLTPTEPRFQESNYGGPYVEFDANTTDQAGRWFDEDSGAGTDHCNAYVNGTEVDDFPSAWCWAYLDELPPGNGTQFRYEATANLEHVGWDARSTIVTEIAYENGSLTEAPAFERFTFDAMDANNTLPKRNVTATLQVDDDVSNATVYVRYADDFVSEPATDGGPHQTASGWNEANVTVVNATNGTLRATIDTRDVATETMHVSATIVDADGDRFTSTAYGAARLTWDRNAERNVSVSVARPDGNASNTTAVLSWYAGTTGVHQLDANGNATFTLPNGSSPTLWVAETDRFGYDTEAPLDGIADVHTLRAAADGELLTDAALGNVTLPRGHRLNVTVATDRGDVVEGASVAVVDVPQGAETAGQALAVGGKIHGETDANGSLVVGNTTGLEANGTVRVDVIVPDEPWFPESLNSTDVTVTNDTNHTVVLETRDVWAPTITNDSVYTDGDDIVFEFDASEPVESVSGEITNDGTVVETIDRSDFQRNGSHYVMRYEAPSSGSYGFVVDEIADAAGNSDYVHVKAGLQIGSTGGGGGGGGGQGGNQDTGTIDIRSWSVSDTTVEPGETVTLTVTVSNTKSSRDVITPALYVDGELIEGQRLTLLPDMKRTVEFTYTFTEEGEHTISPDKWNTKTVVVTSGETTTTESPTTSTTTTVEPSTATTTQATTESSPVTEPAGGAGGIGGGLRGAPGFGPLVAVIALLAVAMLGRRRV